MSFPIFIWQYHRGMGLASRSCHGMGPARGVGGARRGLLLFLRLLLLSILLLLLRVLFRLLSLLLSLLL